MSTIFWRGKVKIVTGELSATAAMQSQRDMVESWHRLEPFPEKTRPLLAAMKAAQDGEQEDAQTDTPNNLPVLSADESIEAERLAVRLIDSMLVKYATRSVEVRDKPDGKWKAVKPGENRVIEASEGEFITLVGIDASVEVEKVMMMLDALPITLSKSWTGQVAQDNREVAEAGFLAWLQIVTQPATPTASPSAPSPSSRRRRTSPTMTTSGAGDTPSTPSSDSMTGSEG